MKALLFSILFVFSSLSFSQSHAQEKTFFTNIDFSGAPYVRVEVAGETLNLLNIDGVSREEIMNKCTATYADLCQCMLTEKFTETMAGIGLPVGDQVMVGLYRMTDHQSWVALLDLTVDNQDALITKRFSDNALCF